VKVTNKKSIRDQITEGRIINFLQQKKAQGKTGNTRQIAAAIDVQRFVVVLFMSHLMADGRVEMTGHEQIHGGTFLPSYTVTK